MLATTNTILADAAETIYRLTADEAIREQYEAREDYYRLQRTLQKEMEQQFAQIVERDAQIVEKDAQIEQQKQYINRINQLYLFLSRDNRQKDLERAYSDDAFREALLNEYHL